MSDMEKIIYQLEKTAEFLQKFGFGGFEAIRDAITLLKKQDAVVMCKDCKHRHSLTGTCVNIDGACFQSYVGDDWFCADGERKWGECHEKC